MNRREFIESIGKATLATLVGSELLTSIGCDNKENYSGYDPSSDEAAIIRAARRKIKERDDKIISKIYIRHDIDQKHPLKIGNDFIVDINPSRTRYGIYKAKGKLGICYVACKDNCKIMKEHYAKRKRMDLFPQYFLGEFVFVEAKKTKNWELAIFKCLKGSGLDSWRKAVFRELKKKDKKQ